MVPSVWVPERGKKETHTNTHTYTHTRSSRSTSVESGATPLYQLLPSTVSFSFPSSPSHSSVSFFIFGFVLSRFDSFFFFLFSFPLFAPASISFSLVFFLNKFFGFPRTAFVFVALEPHKTKQQENKKKRGETTQKGTAKAKDWKTSRTIRRVSFFFSFWLGLPSNGRLPFSLSLSLSFPRARSVSFSTPRRRRNRPLSESHATTERRKKTERKSNTPTRKEVRSTKRRTR